jgi:hypothetical protein
VKFDFIQAKTFAATQNLTTRLDQLKKITSIVQMKFQILWFLFLVSTGKLAETSGLPYHDFLREVAKALEEVQEKISIIAKLINLQSSKKYPQSLQSNNKTVNSNVQSNIFQCEGVTCPEETTSCKLTVNAIEPKYVKIKRTVFCLSSDSTETK